MLVILLDVRQIAARQYVLLTKASSDKLQAPSCDILSRVIMSY